MWMLLFLFLLQANSNPCQASSTQGQSPSLIVQAVDPNWLPVLGAHVTVKPLHGDAGSKSSLAETDKDGYAKFDIAGDADYAINVQLYGFKRESVKQVHLFRAQNSPTPAYVQIKMRLSGPGTTVN